MDRALSSRIMKIRGRNLILILGAFVLCAAVLPVFEIKSNCGRNSAALAAVKAYALMARVEADEKRAAPIRYPDLCSISRSPRNTEVSSRGKLAPSQPFPRPLTAPITAQDIHPHKLIIVCDTPIHQCAANIGSGPPRQPTPRATRTARQGLITLSEYAALDRSAFVNLDEIQSEPSR